MLANSATVIGYTAWVHRAYRELLQRTQQVSPVFEEEVVMTGRLWHSKQEEEL